MSPTVTAPRRSTSDRAAGLPRRSGAPRSPRRVSGPVRGRLGAAQPARPRPKPAQRETTPLGGRALALVRGLPDHSLIDRLVRGRAWIPVLGILLVGIVAMQVEILKLGASMGRTMERSSTLQTRNETLQASVAGLADDQRIERLAAGMGMVMPTPDALVFLSARPNGHLSRALANIQAPDPTGFLTQLAAQAAATAALMPSPPGIAAASATTSSSAAAPATTTSSATAAPATTTSSATVAPATTTSSATAAPATTTSSAPATPATGGQGIATVAPSQSSASGGG